MNGCRGDRKRGVMEDLKFLDCIIGVYKCNRIKIW